ncbi:hypothetical protein KOR42_26260 [Thalassoglobus neptunius]|uniref:Uncharacterized protein n=1 Tax=Thalassoglobus neptunius TaxID=1938619 RepID=A0A5C5X0X9_9PLAN|nr:hypothetical protein [Thalassoglobus neptunius]TWT55815.1 hypothetical protein KOR42_26260 [Thalassoglobus neptunius]
MSYVGKILVVVQVVLSILFMAFAGAVYSMHQNWKGQYEAVQSELALQRQSTQDAQGQLTIAKTELETQLTAAEERAGRLAAQQQAMEMQIKNLTEESNRREALRAEQTGLAEAKAAEARFRQQEAEKQRIENEKLRVALDKSVADNRDLRDEKFTLETNLAELKTNYNRQLEKVGYLERVVAANGLETDPDVVEKLKLPPPPVEGLVREVRKNRANRVQYVSMSIGSDDGLIVGHELDVVRLKSDEANSEWLGRVRVVDVAPDSAVGEVVLPAKYGIIQKGDNVTSRLGT